MRRKGTSFGSESRIVLSKRASQAALVGHPAVKAHSHFEECRSDFTHLTMKAPAFVSTAPMTKKAVAWRSEPDQLDTNILTRSQELF